MFVVRIVLLVQIPSRRGNYYWGRVLQRSTRLILAQLNFSSNSFGELVMFGVFPSDRILGLSSQFLVDSLFCSVYNRHIFIISDNLVPSKVGFRALTILTDANTHAQSGVVGVFKIYLSCEM